MPEAATDVCFWCKEPLGKDRHQDHVLGVVEDGTWNGYPEVIVWAHPVCNTGRRTADGIQHLLADEAVRARFGSEDDLRRSLRQPDHIVDGYNALLRSFTAPITESYQHFLAEVDDWWATLDT